MELSTLIFMLAIGVQLIALVFFIKAARVARDDYRQEKRMRRQAQLDLGRAITELEDLRADARPGIWDLEPEEKDRVA